MRRTKFSTPHMLKPSYQSSSVAFATTCLKIPSSARPVKSLFAAIAKLTGFSKTQILALFAEIRVNLIELTG